MIAWHGLTGKTYAAENEGELVTIKVTYTIPAGQSFMLPTGTSSPDNAVGYEQWCQKEKAPMKSNQKLTEWVINDVTIDLVNGYGVVWGPQTVVFTRSIVDA